MEADLSQYIIQPFLRIASFLILYGIIVLILRAVHEGSFSAGSIIKKIFSLVLLIALSYFISIYFEQGKRNVSDRLDTFYVFLSFSIFYLLSNSKRFRYLGLKESIGNGEQSMLVNKKATDVLPQDAYMQPRFVFTTKKPVNGNYSARDLRFNDEILIQGSDYKLLHNLVCSYLNKGEMVEIKDKSYEIQNVFIHNAEYVESFLGESTKSLQEKLPNWQGEYIPYFLTLIVYVTEL